MTIRDVRDELAALTDQTAEARARFKLWAGPIIAEKRELTDEEALDRLEALDGIAELDARLNAKAQELVAAYETAPRPGPAAVRDAAGEDVDLLTFVDVVARAAHGERPTPYELAICRTVARTSLPGFLDRLDKENHGRDI